MRFSLDTLDSLPPSGEGRRVWRLTNDCTQVREASDSLAAFAVATRRCPPRMERQIAIALAEALYNAIIHGNLDVASDLRDAGRDAEYGELIRTRANQAPYRDRTVEIVMTLMPDRIEWTITDQGVGFEVERLPDPTAPPHRFRFSGRGVLLMRALFDEVRFNEKGNQVTLAVLAPHRDLAHAV